MAHDPTHVPMSDAEARSEAYAHVEHRRIGELPNSDFVMDQVFWIGLYPGLGEAEIDYMIDMVDEAVRTVAR